MVRTRHDSWEEFDDGESAAAPCSHPFWTTWALPCADAMLGPCSTHETPQTSLGSATVGVSRYMHGSPERMEWSSAGLGAFRAGHPGGQGRAASPEAVSLQLAMTSPPDSIAADSPKLSAPESSTSMWQLGNFSGNVGGSEYERSPVVQHYTPSGPAV
jgi:hypothetical protein